MSHQYDESADLLTNLPAERQQSDKRFIVIYDGACGFCTYTVNLVRKVDFLHQFGYVKLQEFSRMKKPKIPYSMLQESIHLVDRKRGDVKESTEALFQLMIRIPPTFPLVVLLVLLRFMRVAEPAYNWVARSRYSISAILKE